jgi:hypothetical protein
MGKFNKLFFSFSRLSKTILKSHKKRAKGISNQSKYCLLNSKYSPVQGKKNKGNRTMVPFNTKLIIFSSFMEILSVMA